MFDLVIANGTLVTSDASTHADLAITNGRITAIGKRLVGLETIDASGMLVLPGAIDEHVHLQMPVGEFSSSDDFYTGTVAAAHGGTTTVMDFIPQDTDDLATCVAAWKRKGEKGAIDYSFHMNVTSLGSSVAAQIPGLRQMGISTLKVLMFCQEDLFQISALRCQSTHLNQYLSQ